MVAPPKFSSLVLLGSFLLQSWDRLEKVPCFNEHAMVLQGFKKRFLITDACLSLSVKVWLSRIIASSSRPSARGV